MEYEYKRLTNNFSFSPDKISGYFFKFG